MYDYELESDVYSDVMDLKYDSELGDVFLSSIYFDDFAFLYLRTLKIT